MVFVDTSIWIEFFKGKDAGLVDRLNTLLDRNEVALAVPIWLELLCGAPQKSQKLFRETLSALPIFYTSEDTWHRAAEWVEEASKKGERFSAIDLLIASFAYEQDASVWSLDNDFKRMEKLNFISTFTFLH